ncbi:hypothetical protein GX586_05180 [bacterium]|nr:hypothetical protein [bacterium]
MRKDTTAPTVVLRKANAESSHWAPLEEGSLVVKDRRAARVRITDGARRRYVDTKLSAGKPVRFAARGSAGEHLAEVLDRGGRALASIPFIFMPRTRISCDRGPYAAIAERIKMFLEKYSGVRPLIINGRLYKMLVSWGRDHVHTLKAQKYFMEDVKSGLEYWLDSQERNGMFRDCIHQNADYPARTWFGEALGKGYFWYDDHMKYIVRRIPVEADCEFLYTEGVWYAWKASGDDAWMAKQLPRLEKALKYNASHPTRWSRKHKLVRRSFCMDSWDFVNPHYCSGDHRCINPGDPQFLFHGDNSGLYSSHWRMAEMHEHLGNMKRAAELRVEGENLRRRANAKLFFDNAYGHMIPEELPEDEVYAKVGDERRRMSLSTGYTINRGLPTHEMAVKILKEYQRRGAEKKAESFAEWWTMDPPYQMDQFPSRGTGGSTVGEYMNGAICIIIAGEIARAACDHGMENYAADIIERVWKLSQRDGGELHQVYRRLPEHPVFPKATFTTIDIRPFVNRGLRNGAHESVIAWTGEGDNDLRDLPVGRRAFGAIEFDVVNPAANDGKAVLFLDPSGAKGPRMVEVPVPNITAKSVYFMQCLTSGVPADAVAAICDIVYADGTVERTFMRRNHEINSWWGVSDAPDTRGRAPVDRSICRVAWRGANPTWANVGMLMTGWNNPHPDKPITAIRYQAVRIPGAKGGIMIGAISASDHPVGFEERIRSHGLPDCWAQAAVYYAVAEGIAGIEDKGRAFDKALVAPRWAATKAAQADVTLHYPASGGYCTYTYKLDRAKKRITLNLTGSFEHARVHCLLPKRAQAKRVAIGTREIAFENTKIERSSYADFDLDALPLAPIEIKY